MLNKYVGKNKITTKILTPSSTGGVFYLELIYYICNMVGIILLLVILIASRFARKINKDKDHPFNKFLNDREK
jgi:hypothetical protein